MFGFLIAVIAGVATPMLETPLARPISRALGVNVEIHNNELRVLAFMIAMIIAGVFCAVFDTGSALGLAVGGTIGYFGMRILRWMQRYMENRPAK